jgi:peptide/nickel transport system ATP-binding protein
MRCHAVDYANLKLSTRVLRVFYMSEHEFIRIDRLSQRFDLSDPWIARLISRRPKQFLNAVDNVSFNIEKGKTYALVGESGSGKSTIALMAVGLLRPTGGSVLIDGHNLYDRTQSQLEHRRTRRRLQMVFQSPYASLNPRWRVGNILSEPLRVFSLTDSQSAERRRVHELLEQVGLSQSDAHRFPHEFSGGQRQRISIARALASRPEFIVCDEPTSALDVSVQAQVLNLLKRLQNDLGLTYLFITHDLAVVRVMAHRIGVLKSGRLIEEESTQSLIESPQSEYTKMLIRSAPRISRGTTGISFT